MLKAAPEQLRHRTLEEKEADRVVARELRAAAMNLRDTTGQQAAFWDITQQGFPDGELATPEPTPVPPREPLLFPPGLEPPAAMAEEPVRMPQPPLALTDMEHTAPAAVLPDPKRQRLRGKTGPGEASSSSGQSVGGVLYPPAMPMPPRPQADGQAAGSAESSALQVEVLDCAEEAIGDDDTG
eukprot:4910026-Lingulodinium_polyedra.AAC.1